MKRKKILKAALAGTMTFLVSSNTYALVYTWKNTDEHGNWLPGKEHPWIIREFIKHTPLLND